MRPFVGVFVLLAGLLAAVPAAAQSAEIGQVQQVRGSVVSIVGDNRRVLAAGFRVHLGEQIVTGAGARAEIGLDDGTRLMVGESARLTVDEFVFNPGGRSIIDLFVDGAFRFIAALLEPGETVQANCRTPFADLGVRGTDFWAGPIDEANGVLLLEGSVSVANAAGSVVLSEPGEGTNVEDFDTPPGPVTQWPDDKVARALASVAF